MEKKTLIITVVGSLIGLLVGVAIGYSVAPYQQIIQTQDLKNQINNLQNQINDLQNQNKNLQNQITQKDNQIQTLQEQVNELQALLGPIRKGAWNLIKTFQGSSDFITDYFYVASSDLRINWTWVSSAEQYAGFYINLYKQGQSVRTEHFSDLPDIGTTYVHNIVPAYYYLDIREANLDLWTITTEVWIPE